MTTVRGSGVAWSGQQGTPKIIAARGYFYWKICAIHGKNDASKIVIL
jgi:hypothetical protein